MWVQRLHLSPDVHLTDLWSNVCWSFFSSPLPLSPSLAFLKLLFYWPQHSSSSSISRPFPTFSFLSSLFLPHTSSCYGSLPSLALCPPSLICLPPASPYFSSVLLLLTCSPLFILHLSLSSYCLLLMSSSPHTPTLCPIFLFISQHQSNTIQTRRQKYNT